jgi:ppGpp synthetase/RelA/SpoT-type nucleotidyltranferase
LVDAGSIPSAGAVTYGRYNQTTTMNYEQFIREQRALYEAFARTVAGILQAAIDNHPKEFRLQQIQARAKDPVSLQRKLTERGLVDSDQIETELKDLAGCRLILYTNTDVDRFLNSRLIFENFAVDFDGSKIHRAVGQDRTADQLYFAIHYLVSLKPDRLALPEYSRFQGLRCEVQIQTILDHAWAETTHDIVYHRQPLDGFGTSQFEQIKERTAKIMNKYLLPAGYEFQKVQHDFERLMQGKELFDRGTLEALEAAGNNNERYDYLHQIKDNLLPFYDDIPTVAPELIRVASSAIKKARTVATTPIETPFGQFNGSTLDQVVNAALEIIDQLCYVDIQATFRVLCDLYATADSSEERRRLLQSVESLARNDVEVWRQVGFGVQKVLLEEIEALGDSDKERLRSIVLQVCQQILNPEVTGTSWSFNAATLQRGAVSASDAYAEFRKKALALLFGMYRNARSAGEKMEIIHTLHEATRFPMSAGRGDALVDLVLDDARAIVEFFAERTESEPPEIIQHLENQFLWLYRHNEGTVGSEPADGVSPNARALTGAIITFRERANSVERFVRFKTLVGFESVFPPEWEDDGMDIEGSAAYRATKLTEYVASITEGNADEWYEVVELCASIKSNDGAMFPSFTQFLTQLSARSPAIVLGYLNKNEELLRPFLPAILDGLEKSAQPDKAIELMDRWVEQGRQLAEMARHLRLAIDPNPDLTTRIAGKALLIKDSIATIEAVAVVIQKRMATVVDDVLVPGIRYLTSIGDTRWVHAIWFITELQPFLRTLSEGQSKSLLENLTLRKRLDHQDERFLEAVATAHPQLVWLFFKERIEREKAKTGGDRYEAVPFQLMNLRTVMARDPSLGIDTVRAWFTPEDNLFTYGGGRLLHNVFPTVTGDFERRLVSLVREGDTSDIGFVLSVLRAYREGDTSLHKVCKELVERLPVDDERVQQIETILESTGMVMGEFGFVDAFQRKKREMEPWLSDPRQKVREFAERHCRSLERRAASEQRRSESNHELRRREWPDEE